MFNNLNDYSNKDLQEKIENVSESELNEQSESTNSLLEKSNKDSHLKKIGSKET